MANDPAFLFYPGDYLRDTQCLSERVQVAYDRIMCEHMRNICISQAQLNFFTKRLTDDERSELEMVLSKIDGGYQIAWVAESINKRKAYSESRRSNRKSKPKPETSNTSQSYDNHMENEIENVSVIKKEKKGGAGGKHEKELVMPFYSENFDTAWAHWKQFKDEQFKFKYKGVLSEQAALNELATLSDGHEGVAIKIIHQSISKGWKGLFKLKDEPNATGKTQRVYTAADFEDR